MQATMKRKHKLSPYQYQQRVNRHLETLILAMHIARDKEIENA